MISEADDLRRRDRALLAWSFLASLVLNLSLWALVTGWHPLTSLLHPVQEPAEQVVSTSVIRLERVVPEPVHTKSAAEAIAKARTSTTRPQSGSPSSPAPIAEHVEIARLAPHAPPQPRAPSRLQSQASLAEILAQQQAALARDAQRINASRAPLSNATIDPNHAPSSNRSYQMDYSGLPQVTQGEGYIEPINDWHDGGLHCYYTHYEYHYPQGGTESANIPWPICFTPYNDPLARGARLIPLPRLVPPDDYHLPAGSDLTPIERAILDYWNPSNR